MQSFYVGVKAIIQKERKILIVKNTTNMWELPGGRIDAGEAVNETLLRELAEEVRGVQVKEICETIHEYAEHKIVGEGNALFLIFKDVEATVGGEITLSHEHTAYAWVHLEEIDEYPLYKSCKQAIVKSFGKTVIS